MKAREVGDYSGGRVRRRDRGNGGCRGSGWKRGRIKGKEGDLKEVGMKGKGVKYG